MNKNRVMYAIKNKNGVETLIFAETFEHEAFEQVKNLVNFEAYLDSKVRIMPDAHAGKGCTIGTTIQLTDKVTPNLVGVDIGCGMLAVKLKNKEVDFDRLDFVLNNIIPSGNSINSIPKGYFNFNQLRCKENVDLHRAILSIGTLGGSNHFGEVGRLEGTDDLYLIIHSGSRKLGVEVCKYYQDKAFNSMNKRSDAVKNVIEKLKSEGREKDIEAETSKIKIPTVNKNLAYLTGDDFLNYMNDMIVVQNFASLNRMVMADIILREVNLQKVEQFETVHNYIDCTRMILRKGAVSAENGETLLIPINMRDGSLLCVGKGNKNWNYSAPHGAGRLMSRSVAKEAISLNDFEDSMKDIYTTSVNSTTLDEAPQAYKSIDEIKSTITDTVDIVGVIKPLYNFKSH